MRVNTRIAPSPTGDMHIGTARTAYFNWLAARSSGGKFILRIDDTDRQRSLPEYTQVIFDTRKWLNLDYDLVVYQSSRLERYKQAAQLLVERGLAQDVDGAIRLCLHDDYCPREWKDLIGGIKIVSPEDYEPAKNLVLIKSDGWPTYNFATVVDDIDYDINLIIRGVDHISNTPRQIVVYNLMNAVIPQFAHLGLICVKNKPMSKRDSAASMLHYRNNGYNPDAMLNFLARMGWGPRVDDKTTKLLPRERMLELFFDGGKMKSSYSNFDQDKLDSFDRKYKALIK